MKRILGGMICLLLPALALAQDGGPAGIDHLLSEGAVTLLREAPDVMALPVGASRVFDAKGDLLLVGGVEADPQATLRPYRQWDPTSETWTTLRTTLPQAFLMDFPVAAAWVGGASPGLLTFGLVDNATGGPAYPEAFFQGAQLGFDDVLPCEVPPNSIGSPIFATKPEGALGTPDTLLLYLVESDLTGNPTLWGRLYSVSVEPANQRACLQPLLESATLPTDHLLGSLVFDPQPQGGDGALVFAGGLETEFGSNYLQKTLPTIVFADGTVRSLADWPTELAAAQVLPSPVGGLLFLTPRPTVPGTGAAPTFQEAHWSEAENQYRLTPRAAHLVELDPLRLSGLSRVPTGFLPRVTFLPEAAGTLFNEHFQPASLGFGGETLEPSSESAELLWDGIFFGATMQLYADRERVELYPDAGEVSVRFRVTLNDEPMPGWRVVGQNEQDDTTGLEVNVPVGGLPEDGTFALGVTARDPGTSSLEVFIEDADNGVANSGTLPVTVDERESLYTGFRCQSDEGGLGLGLALLLVVSLGLLLRRRALPLLLLGLLLLPAAGRAAEEEDDRPKLAFLGVTPGAGVDAATAEAISDYIQTLAASTQGYQLIRLTEVKEMLGFEAQRQLLGCDDGSCMADLAGALEVDRLLRASVSRLGESMVVQLTLLDGLEATQLGASGMRLEKTENAEAVLDVLPDILNEIFATDPRFEGKKVKHRSRNVRSHTRERRWSFGAGADIDLTHGGAALLGAHVGYRGRFFGFGLGLMPRMGESPIPGEPVPVGMRGEVRLRLFQAGPVHPQLALGATYFPRAAPLLRVALHTEIDFHRYLRGFVAIAGEALPTDLPFDRLYLVLNVGAAWTP